MTIIPCVLSYAGQIHHEAVALEQLKKIKIILMIIK